MFYVYYQQQNKIEINISDSLDAEEFRQIIHQLESLSAMYQEIHVLLDAINLDRYQFKIFLDEFDFFKKYSKNLKSLAVVSDKKFASFLLDQFARFTETEIKTFGDGEIEQARKWIFPSRLPG